MSLHDENDEMDAWILANPISKPKHISNYMKQIDGLVKKGQTYRAISAYLLEKFKFNRNHISIGKAYRVYKKSLLKVEPTDEVVEQEPTTQTVEQKPTEEVVKQEPTDKVVKQEPTTQTVEQEPTDEVVEQEPTEDVFNIDKYERRDKLLNTMLDEEEVRELIAHKKVVNGKSEKEILAYIEEILPDGDFGEEQTLFLLTKEERQARRERKMREFTESFK